MSAGPPGPLDKPLWFTIFPTLAADTRESVLSSARGFSDRLRDTRAPTKQMLELFSPCSYDSKRTALGSLRSNANVRECFAVIADYDGEKISFDDAVAAARQANVAMVIVPSPSRVPGIKERWRAIAPLAQPLHKRQGSLREHLKYTSWLAGIFADSISTESYTLSQSYYIGTVTGALDHRVEFVEGDYLDQRPDLAATARGKPTVVRKAKPTPKPRAKTQPSPGVTTETNTDQASRALVSAADADLLAAVGEGKGSHAALLTLAGKFAAGGVPVEAAETILLETAEQRPEDQRDPGWTRMCNDIPRILKGIYAKEAETQGRLTAVMASAPRRERRVSTGNGASSGVDNGVGNGAGHNAGNGTAALVPAVADPDPDPGTGGPPPPGGGPGTGAGPGAPPPPRPGGAAQAGVRGMLRDKKPRYASNVANVKTVLQSMPALIGCVAFDEMALQVVLCRALPGDQRFTGRRPLTDDDVTRVQDFLQYHADMGRIGREAVQHGIDHVAREHGFHPVRDFLRAQPWDGVKRLDAWLPVYIGTADNEYTRGIGRMWLIGMVARIELPGCQFDYMLILEGPQGVGKSTVARVLCDPWTTDQVDLRQDSRMVSQMLRGVWLAELAELSAFRHAEAELLKSFITRRIEHYVPRYAARDVIEPRQCGLMGTTNRAVYLTDTTGMRRGWPVKVGTIELDKLQADRVQLWAEALVAYQSGELWHPQREFEAKYLQPEQDERHDEDGWTPLVANYLERFVATTKTAQDVWDKQTGIKRPKDRPQVRLVPVQVYREALTLPGTSPVSLPHFSARDLSRIADILDRLGWERARKTGSHRWWVPKP